MIFRIGAILTIVASLAFSGCTSSRKLDEMSIQIGVLEQQNRAIEDKLLEADSLNRSLLEALTVFKARTEFADKAGDARLDEISAKLNDALDRMDRLQQSMAALQQGLVRTPVSETSDSSADSTAEGITYVDARKLFDAAFKDMAAGDYALAVLGFKEYIKTFANTDLADDAQFWIGECYYRQGDYSTARDEFLKIEKSFLDSDRMASALYKIGRCYLETGDMVKAKDYFSQTISRFPESAESELAKEKLEGL